MKKRELWYGLDDKRWLEYFVFGDSVDEVEVWICKTGNEGKHYDKPIMLARVDEYMSDHDLETFRGDLLDKLYRERRRYGGLK